MADCVLCDVATRDVHGHVVAETRHALAFLAVEPRAAGHVVVVPKDHYARLAALPADQVRDVFALVHDLAGRVERAVDAGGLTVGVDDGAAAGQDVEHVHVHVIPRFDDDGGGHLGDVAGERPDLPESQLDAVADAIREAVADGVGVAGT
jgi:histidine triad (HIT) family protein